MDNIPISDSLDEERSRSRLIILAALGVAGAACCIVFISAFFLFQPDQLSLVDKYFPSPTATFTPTLTPSPTNTSTPTITPTPTISPTPTSTPTAYLLIPPLEDVTILEEDFDSNDLHWNAFYNDNTLDIHDGKLYLKSNTSGYVGLGLCNGCPLYDKAFYYQAELVLAKNTSLEHGIAFCATAYSSQYYVFHIDSMNQLFNLYKNTTSGWETLLSGIKSDFIHKYPNANTLGVQFDQGHIQLYINGNLVKSYTDPLPISCRRIGIYINGGVIDVIADNIYAYKIESSTTVTPTP